MLSRPEELEEEATTRAITISSQVCEIYNYYLHIITNYFCIHYSLVHVQIENSTCNWAIQRLPTFAKHPNNRYIVNSEPSHVQIVKRANALEELSPCTSDMKSGQSTYWFT